MEVLLVELGSSLGVLLFAGMVVLVCAVSFIIVSVSKAYHQEFDRDYAKPALDELRRSRDRS